MASTFAGAQATDTAKPRQLTPEEKRHVDSLNQIRTQAGILNNVVGLLQHRIGSSQQANEPLPSWPELFDSIDNVKSSLAKMNRAISKNQDRLDRVIVYPQSNFPWPDLDGALWSLLDTKHSVEAENLVASGELALRESGKTHADLEEFSQMLDWAVDTVRAGFLNSSWSADFTEEELENGWENVRTGLKRELNSTKGLGDDDEIEYEEEEEEQEEDAPSGSASRSAHALDDSDIRKAPKVNLDTSMKFMVGPTSNLTSGGLVS